MFQLLRNNVSKKQGGPRDCVYSLMLTLSMLSGLAARR